MTNTITKTKEGRITLIGGGVRSGKSAFAVERALALGPSRVFVATARPVDPDMAARIARHRRDRDERFETAEEPLELARVLGSLCEREVDVVVVDCVTLWLSNLMLRHRDRDPGDLLADVDDVIGAARRGRHETIFVTNEVGHSLHADTELGRKFQDLSGWANQRLARAADQIYVSMLGVVVRVVPGPLAAAEREARP
jgi:adenosylcobinamide kinase/adenosylcobinamide-phosphate guanylyltransferase